MLFIKLKLRVFTYLQGTWLGVFKKAAIAPKGSKMMSSAATTTLSSLARASGPFIRIAGLSGAAAVALGAYGAHSKYFTITFINFGINFVF
jgi:hypothetical protein